MSHVTHIVKRAGHSEPYVEAKLHESIEIAALSVRALEGEAHLLAERVSGAVSEWVHDKAEVTSRDLHEMTSSLLDGLHSEAAYAYHAHDYAL